MILIPAQIDYIELYFTLRCNYNCSYCINAQRSIVKERKELSIDELISGLAKLDFSKHVLTIGGGEPTIRPDFYNFIQRLPEEIKIDLLSNLQFDVDEFIKKVNPQKFSKHNNPAYKSIRISYHPSMMNANTLIQKAKYLQEAGYSIGIFGINHPCNMKANIEMSEIARNNKIYFFIKDFLGSYENQEFGYYKYKDGISGKKNTICWCRTSELLIDPAGDVYKCHLDLYSKKFVIDNIVSQTFKPQFIFRRCCSFGECNPCDMKIKLGHSFEGSSCAVEIKFE